MNKKYKLNILTSKLSGFTLHEVAIAMIITGIIVCLTFTILQYYKNLFFSITSIGDLQTEINNLQSVLNNDAFKAQEILYEKDITFNYKDQVIKYILLEDTIIRETLLGQDLFHIPYSLQQLHYVSGSSRLVQYVLFTCKNEDLEIDLTIFKRYPDGTLLEENY